MQRIVSLQPSITLTLAELGALDQLVACTKYCADVCPEVVQRQLPIVHDSWTADSGQIAELRPTLVLASVPYRLESVAEILKAHVPVVLLSPKTLADVYSDIELLGRIVSRVAAAEKLLAVMRLEIAEIRLVASSLPRQTVYCEEWGKPLIQSQAWVAELINAAGGSMIGTPGAQVTPEAVRDADPDVLLAAWCGAGDRVPLEKIVRDRQWLEMKAVTSGRVFCINDEFLNTPAHCLVRGLRAIAWALHPEDFPKPPGIRAIAR